MLIYQNAEGEAYMARVWEPLTYSDGSITNMWNLNVFINDLPLSCRRAKKSLLK